MNYIGIADIQLVLAFGRFDVMLAERLPNFLTETGSVNRRADLGSNLRR